MVLDGDTGQVEGFDVACSFSPDTMLEECTLPPTSFDHGRSLRYQPLTRSFEFDFPAPVGRLRVWNTDHEESELIALELADKGLAHVDFFIHLDDDWVDVVRALRRLGLDSTEPLTFRGATFSPREFVVSRLPRAVDLKGHVKGDVCVGTLALGSQGGQPVCRYVYQMTSHEQAFARLGAQGTGYQTGIPAAAGVSCWRAAPSPCGGRWRPAMDPSRSWPRCSRRAAPGSWSHQPPQSIDGLLTVKAPTGVLSQERPARSEQPRPRGRRHVLQPKGRPSPRWLHGTVVIHFILVRRRLDLADMVSVLGLGHSRCSPR